MAQQKMENPEEEAPPRTRSALQYAMSTTTEAGIFD
jgi:hypothetical protein